MKRVRLDKQDDAPFQVGETVYTDVFPLLKETPRTVSQVYEDEGSWWVLTDEGESNSLRLVAAWFYRDINGSARNKKWTK